MIKLVITLTERNGLMSIAYEAEGDDAAPIEIRVAEAIMGALPAIEAYGLGPILSVTDTTKSNH